MTNLDSSKAVEVEDLIFSYSKDHTWQKISFVVNTGEIISLLGRSGCGKTTLFRLLTGLNIPTAGSISLNGEVSYMTQHSLLLPWRTVLGNLLLLRELGKNVKSRQPSERRALEFLKEVGLAGYEHFFPNQLSGGMQSRVSLARILLEDKPILLLDEPFAYLDAITRLEMQALLVHLQKKYNKTIVLVTHDITEATQISDRIFLLSQGTITHNWEVPKDHKMHPPLVASIQEALYCCV